MLLLTSPYSRVYAAFWIADAAQAWGTPLGHKRTVSGVLWHCSRCMYCVHCAFACCELVLSLVECTVAATRQVLEYDTQLVLFKCHASNETVALWCTCIHVHVVLACLQVHSILYYVLQHVVSWFWYGGGRPARAVAGSVPALRLWSNCRYKRGLLCCILNSGGVGTRQKRIACNDLQGDCDTATVALCYVGPRLRRCLDRTVLMLAGLLRGCVWTDRCDSCTFVFTWFINDCGCKAFYSALIHVSIRMFCTDVIQINGAIQLTSKIILHLLRSCCYALKRSIRVADGWPMMILLYQRSSRPQQELQHVRDLFQHSCFAVIDYD